MLDLKRISNYVLNKYEDALRRTPQSPIYHAEGDVYEHTMNVCDALLQMKEYQQLNAMQRDILYLAALLHDVGKINTTQFIDSDWHSPHHAPVGSNVARELLWKEFGLCGSKEETEIREAICLLVRYHSFPPMAMDMEDVRLKLHRVAANSLLVPDFSLRLLCLLSKADMLGRVSYDKQEKLEKIEFCQELAKEEGCYESCYDFPSLHTQRTYLLGGNIWKEQNLYDDYWGEVVLMSGLPGTGKDTWIKHNLPMLPMISLDEIRIATKTPPTANQGKVANIAREQAKNYLRQRQPFVWNATNITATMRETLVSLFEKYHAHVRIVYLETQWQTILQRNSSRENSVPIYAIEKMLKKVRLPERYEALKVEWYSV